MTKFIAELGSNHNGDYGRACALIDVAAHIGCAGVKLQLFRVDRLFAPEALAANPVLEWRRAYEVPVHWLAPLCARAHANGLLFGVTPFDCASADVLCGLPLDFIKIASYSLLHTDLLRLCAAMQKPLLVSTGMATTPELGTVHQQLGFDRRDLTWLHCVSRYPTPVAAAGLSRIEHLNHWFGENEIGLSDHSAHPAVILKAAWRYSVHTFEVHLDVDGQGAEWADGHCWLPGVLADVIQTLRDGETADQWVLDADNADRPWRADPADGLRPLQAFRAGLSIQK